MSNQTKAKEQNIWQLSCEFAQNIALYLADEAVSRVG